METRQLTDDVIAAHINASTPFWLNDPDLPDPHSYADIRQRPDLVARSLRRRVMTDSEAGQPRRFDYPKPVGNEFRHMTVLDPYAQLIMHIVVGAVVKNVETVLSPAVLHARMAVAKGAWSTRSWRAASAAKRAFVADNLACDDFEGYGTTDVRAHYATISLDVIERQLHSASCTQPSVARVMHFLKELHAIPGTSSGLPIGPEASAPLGTLALRAFDQRLLGAGATFTRYVDDLTIFTPTEADFWAHIAVLDDQASVLGQALNPAKTVFNPAESEAPEAGESSGGGGGRRYSDDPARDLGEAAELGDEDQVPFLLAQLGRSGDASGVRLLEETRWIVRQLPRQSAKYLRSLRSSIDNWEWIREEVITGRTQEQAATALHFAPLLERSQLPPSYGAEAFNAALALDVQRFSPLRAMLFALVGRSQEKPKLRTKRALDLADELGDLNERRALLGSLRATGGLSGVSKAGVRHLAKVVPDLAATGAWALAA